MLERSAGCVETGNIRRFLTGSTRLKSRRMLHSAFWNHGATDLEILPLWSALISRHDAVDDEEGRTRAVGGSGGPFLDFLYPSGALKIVRHFSTWVPDRQENRKLRVRFARLGQRLYTSTSDASRIASRDRSHEKIGAPDNKELEQPERIEWLEEDTVSTPSRYKHVDPSRLLEAILHGQGTKEYEEAWRLFELTEDKQRENLTPRLWIYLSTSTKKVDVERSRLLFKTFRKASGPGDFVSLIRYLLSLENTTKAVEVHDEVLKIFDIPVGSDILLAGLLKSSQWQLAYEVVNKFRDFRNCRPTLSYNIWSAVDYLPKLQDHAIEMANFIRGFTDITPRSSADIVSFTGEVVNRTLLTLAESEDVDAEKFYELLRLFRLLHADSAPRYERLLPALVRSGHHKFAVRCYRQYRRNSTQKISRPILDEMMKIFLHHRSVLGMQQILDDWFRYYKRPAPRVYMVAMPMFASLGDAATVNALFKQYVKTMALQNRKINLADDFAPLLHVYAIRGEISELLKTWEKMKTNFDVQPNVKSFNILLNGFAKVNDVDGAQEAFEALLLSGLKPDSYTYGTLMGMCVARGDTEKVMELYQAADLNGIAKTAPMINCIVLTHLQQDRLVEAEEICEAALKMELKESRTRMWNYLLNSYGLRRDLKGANRILRRMKDVGVEYDEATYSALMQALAMVKQPDQAYAVLKDIMPAAGITVRDYHYALVMGGYIANTEVHKVWEVYRRMINSGRKPTSSTRLMALKAAAIQDQQVIEHGSDEVRLNKAEQYFYDAYTSTDRQEITGSLKKGQGGAPVDVGAQVSYFAFLIFVYGQQHAFARVKQLYEQYLNAIPEQRRGHPPVKILSALMVGNLNEKNYAGVQQCWDLAFEQAVKDGRHVRRDLGIGCNPPGTDAKPEPSVLRKHRFDLSIPLSTYIKSLASQDKLEAIKDTVTRVEKAGFSLDMKNWNLCVQVLVRGRDYARAFELCETKMMARWTGWPQQRWKAPVRNRLSVELRAARKRPEHIRPTYQTLILLAKAYMDIRDAAMESANASWLLDHLQKDFPHTLRAIETLPRDSNPTELDVLGQ